MNKDGRGNKANYPSPAGSSDLPSILVGIHWKVASMRLVDLLEEPEPFLLDRLLFVDSGNHFPAREALFGHVVSDVAICFGTRGWREVPEDHRVSLRSSGEGRFAAVFDGGTDWVIRADHGGQEELFLYSASPQEWMISTSLYLLALRAQQRGMPLSRDARHIRVPSKGMFSSVPHSSRTPFAEIARVPTIAELRIDKASKQVRMCSQTVESSLDNYLALSPETLAVDFLADSVSNLYSLMKSRDFVCDLTGGYDSRLVFGMAHLASLAAGQSLQTFSNKSRLEDFRIAQEICAHHELAEPSNAHRFPRGVEKIALTTRTSLQAWLLYAFDGKSGMDAVPKLIIPKGAPVVQATGHVSASSRFQNSLQNLKKSARANLPFQEFEIWEEELKIFLEHPVDFEESVPQSNMMLFLNSFAPNHSGGNWRWLLGGTLRWTPLTSAKYLALHLACLKNDIDPNRIQPSLLSATSPHLLSWPHNKIGSTWPIELTSNPIFERKGELALTDKKVYGFDEVSGRASHGAEHSIVDAVQTLLDAAEDSGQSHASDLVEWEEMYFRDLSDMSDANSRQKLQHEFIPGTFARQEILNLLLE